MEVIQFWPAKGVRMTNDKISRSRHYRISRTRNVLINAREAIGELGTLPEDLMHISRAIFQEYENIKELIALLEAAQRPANKNASAPPPSRAPQTKRTRK